MCASAECGPCDEAQHRISRQRGCCLLPPLPPLVHANALNLQDLAMSHFVGSFSFSLCDLGFGIWSNENMGCSESRSAGASGSGLRDSPWSRARVAPSPLETRFIDWNPACSICGADPCIAQVGGEGDGTCIARSSCPCRLPNPQLETWSPAHEGPCRPPQARLLPITGACLPGEYTSHFTQHACGYGAGLPCLTGGGREYIFGAPRNFVGAWSPKTTLARACSDKPPPPPS